TAASFVAGQDPAQPPGRADRSVGPVPGAQAPPGPGQTAAGTLGAQRAVVDAHVAKPRRPRAKRSGVAAVDDIESRAGDDHGEHREVDQSRSEEHTSEL